MGKNRIARINRRGISLISNGLIKNGKVEINEFTRELSFFEKGTVKIKQINSFDGIQEFTLELVVTPSRLNKSQYLIDSEIPPIQLELQGDGTIIGRIHTEDGWESVESGPSKINKNETASIRLIHDGNGSLSLEINDQQTNQEQTNKNLIKLGNRGITIGGDILGKSHLFSGTISAVRIRPYSIKGSDIDGYSTQEKMMKAKLSNLLGSSNRINVSINPDSVDHRFDEVKAILRSVGVEDISTLSTLKIDEPITIEPNKVIIAAPKTTSSSIIWKDIAKSLSQVSDEKAVEITATMLPNQNSVNVIKNLLNQNNNKTIDTGNYNDDNTWEKDIGNHPFTDKDSLSGRKNPLIVKTRKSNSLTEINKAANIYKKPLIGEMIKPIQGFELKSASLIEDLILDNPDAWPGYTSPEYIFGSSSSIPIDSSVIIAGQLDLTNQPLEIQPEVKKLYIIAEEIICDHKAAITWKKPGGFTPDKISDNNKNGLSYDNEVKTSGRNKNGLNGGDGLNGSPGIPGENGLDAPSLEIWSKHLTAIPNIDLNGEQGIKGGRGQCGGKGGNGAKGEPGKWWWFFGVHCWEDPGHGGDGGNGGIGGKGGHGGDGGHGGNISIGVLQGTLASSVEARSLKMKNQGGNAGMGGDGGNGGIGGYGGSHGNDWKDGKLVCGTGKNGSEGAQGQPGSDGLDGNQGIDGAMNFFEFTEYSWNEQFTKPWLYELTPHHIFPGDSLTITGTRFTDRDRVFIGNISLNPRINADDSITVDLPNNISGGEKDLFVCRFDGEESNHLRFWVKPSLDILPSELVPNMTVTIKGRAFLNGAKIIYNGLATDTTYLSSSELEFKTQGTGGENTQESIISVRVRNPDGEMSNQRTSTIACVLDTGIQIGIHDFSFDNFASGNPSWSTFEDTFGAYEVWHELLDPIFGHPILTSAFFAFYKYFLLGTDNGGLATGFCTAMSSVLLDEFYKGSNDTHTRYNLNEETRKLFTAIHGRLLSRESLIDLHNQCLCGNSNVETVFRCIESGFRDGVNRESAPLLFFVPSGAIWEGDNINKLAETHCVVPIRIVYPIGHDGISIEGTKLYCWDCNHPIIEGIDIAHNCRIEFRQTDGEIRFDYYDGMSLPMFSSEMGITLASMSNGKYLLSDHDLPFSGPFGVTHFCVDFLLSSANLLIEDVYGNRTGSSGSNIFAEIPNSVPSYLAKNFYMLPANQAFTRKITGFRNGNYSFHSLSPIGTFLSLEDVTTVLGEEDILSINADYSQLRFIPGSSKDFQINIAKEFEDQIRAISIEGVGAGSQLPADITISPDLSILRIGNRDIARSVNAQVTVYNKNSGTHDSLNQTNINLPTDHDLLITVTDWENLDMTIRNLPFNI